MRINYSGELGARGHRQGPDPGDDRPPRHRRHGRPRGRVRRAGDRGALDGGPDDDLQHDDRGRRPRRHDRPRRDDLRVGRGPARRARRTSTPRSSAGASCRPTTGAELRHRGRDRRRRASRRWSPGARTPGMVVEVTDAVPDPAALDAPADRETAERALAYMALEPGTPMTRDRARPRLHRLLHQLADRGPARGGRDRRGPQGRATRCARWSSPAPQQVKAQAEAGGPRRGLPRRRLRVARGRLLDVPRDEPRHPGRGRALRLDLEPQLRGPPGQGRAHPPGQPADGRGGGDRGPLRRHPGLERDAMRGRST